MKHPHDEDTQTLISKYFDEVITSSDIDPTKRPGVALEWAKEKELWAKQMDEQTQRELLLALKKSEDKKLHSSKLSQQAKLHQIQQFRLQELAKRAEYLEQLKKTAGKLPKVNKKMLNADVKIDDELKTTPQIDLAKIDDEHDNDDNYGTVLMREIARSLYDEHQMYNRPPVPPVPVVVNKPPKTKKIRVRNRKGPKSKW
ncbi:hypothetical protein [Spiroplasma eriocheiris]|uniref:Uncharacterized protein n=1 Tax=Spiroplasma eriocheiris TaxID=315358 RepID=A0A0H3XJR9_9MOLU|nr:hypothetical protein [Spiroplasma eriocheiris]AHF57663.1 hypothetical protein SPE_0535 [Spiroplasma eriocheiris CCTCC M 207170]AKM54116.1 hypothetical protein SERIO_v1c05420 [Spiroplasma eriocheiris]